MNEGDDVFSEMRGRGGDSSGERKLSGVLGTMAQWRVHAAELAMVLISSGRNVTLAVVGVAVLWLSVLAGAQGGSETFKIRLTTVPIDFVEAPNVTGSGMATATLAGDTVTISGTFDGLHGPATTAHLHRGRAKGVRGAVIADLTVSTGTSGRISGTVKLTSAQIDAVKSGMIYVQINSETATEGNLWGWLLK